MTKAPYYIRAVIDAHTVPEPDISGHVLEELFRDGLIDKNSMGVVRTTPRGQAYVKLLEAVPLPEQK